ncbi:hypothetical protein D3C85_1667380 [compost metagenome]
MQSRSKELLSRMNMESRIATADKNPAGTLNKDSDKKMLKSADDLGCKMEGESPQSACNDR